MKKIPFLLLILSVAVVSCGKAELVSKSFAEPIVVDGVHYEIVVFGYDSSKHTGYFNHERIELKASPEAAPLQILEVGGYSRLDENGNVQGVVLDHNFDGYQDFRLSTMETTQNLPCALWLYNNSSKTFEYSDILQTEGSLEVNVEEKELKIMIGSPDFYYLKIYGLLGMNLDHTREEHYHTDADANISTITYYEKLNGEMREVGTMKMLITENGSVEIKKSGEFTDSKEMSAFLGTIFRERIQIFYPAYFNTEYGYFKNNESCYFIPFEITRFMDESGQSEYFNAENFPVIYWKMEGEENYSVTKIVYRNSGLDFTAYYRFLFLKNDNNPSDLRAETFQLKFSFVTYKEQQLWVVTEDQYAYNSQNLYVQAEDWADLEQVGEPCYDIGEEYYDEAYPAIDTMRAEQD